MKYVSAEIAETRNALELLSVSVERPVSETDAFLVARKTLSVLDHQSAVVLLVFPLVPPTEIAVVDLFVLRRVALLVVLPMLTVFLDSDATETLRLANLVL